MSEWPMSTAAPGPTDVVQVLMTEEMARRFEERVLGVHTVGPTALSPPLLFREGDVPTYIITTSAGPVVTPTSRTEGPMRRYVEWLRGRRLTVAHHQIAEERRFQEVLMAEQEKVLGALVVLRDAAWYVPVKDDRTADEQERVQAFTEAVVAVAEMFTLPEKVRRTEAEVAAALGASGRAEDVRAWLGGATPKNQNESR